jgi:putative transposase
MRRNRFAVDQVIRMTRKAAVHLPRRESVVHVSREFGVSEKACYWRGKEQGGMKVSWARRVKEREQENTRLKRAVAHLILASLL